MQDLCRKNKGHTLTKANPSRLFKASMMACIVYRREKSTRNDPDVDENEQLDERGLSTHSPLSVLALALTSAVDMPCTRSVARHE